MHELFQILFEFFKVSFTNDYTFKVDIDIMPEILTMFTLVNLDAVYYILDALFVYLIDFVLSQNIPDILS